MTLDHIIRLVSADELESLIAAFLDDCAVTDLSPQTIANCCGVLDRSHLWCRKHAAPINPTQQTDLRKYLTYVKDPGTYRHERTVTVNANRAGLSEFHLPALLGHSDLETVSRYVKLAVDVIRRTSQEHSPLDHLKLSL